MNDTDPKKYDSSSEYRPTNPEELNYTAKDAFYTEDEQLRDDSMFLRSRGDIEGDDYESGKNSVWPYLILIPILFLTVGVFGLLFGSNPADLVSPLPQDTQLPNAMQDSEFAPGIGGGPNDATNESSPSPSPSPSSSPRGLIFEDDGPLPEV